ncbi:uncharacterized protein AB675_12051 [Cyphellophora attinorum]|uniref:Uncharacterized protein n=1 Tax=Cyphellophora attinorum TaxID=1664694 RepID=A0A0N0NKR6_9EURO|nr:uncharacterized protein AB675_12051 [Phialophora attinorum]KPI38461.1 hypothetical protein AB675_12051 [Phialophora attinorum]
MDDLKSLDSALDYIAAIELQSKAKECSTATAIKAPAKKKIELLDMPNEMLKHIFEAVFVGEEIYFVVGVGRLPYDLGGPDSGGQDQSWAESPRQWNEPWAPNLRLVSSVFKAMVTPILIEYAILHVERGQQRESGALALAPRALELAPLCPSLLTSHLKCVRIKDYGASSFIRPVKEVDVTGLPNLRTVAFGPFDIADTLKAITIGLRHLPSEQQKAAHLYHLERRTVCFPIADHLRIFRGDAQTRLQNLCKAFLPSFDDPKRYHDMMYQFWKDYWMVSRDAIQGLRSSTNVNVTMVDEARKSVIALVKIPDGAAPSVDFLDEAISKHKESPFLLVFREA